MSIRRPIVLGLALLGAGLGAAPALHARQPGNDLDRFMAQVLARRDDNWRKLQQYVLDERERAEASGPGGLRLFGMDREYTWYIRDGVFVRSPVRFDGVALSEDERQKAEQEWIAQERARDRDKAAEAGGASPGAGPAGDGSVEALLRATREPQFVSAAYFLRFKFEPGRYAFVGPETYEGRQVLRIEYYPTKLYTENTKDTKDTKDTKNTKDTKDTKDSENTKDTKDTKESATNTKGTKNTHGGRVGRDAQDEEAEERINRQMNKMALVTLWVEPTEHQIVKYRLDNIALSFLPARSVVRVNGFGATMRMGQPFAGVWLPEGIDAAGSVTLANGTYDIRYDVTYEHYREAAVQVKVR